MIERRTQPAADSLPAHGARHIAIIMDGNRRWAAENDVSVVEGHRAGGRALRTVSKAAAAAGVAYLTVYAFSEENWRRDPGEVGALMETIRAFATDEASAMQSERVCVRTIGNVAGLPPATREAVGALCEATSANGGLVLTLALNYSARTEIATGIRRLAEDVAARRLAADAIDDDVLERYLRTAGLPDPDLLIRSGGELRLSNFLLYELAYTELWSTTVHWPAFNGALLETALADFATRQRRFGS